MEGGREGGREGGGVHYTDVGTKGAGGLRPP